MIEVKDLTRYYGEIRAIHNVSFQVKKGEILGLLGPNAAGKTTTMKILTCYMPPSSGGAKAEGNFGLENRRGSDPTPRTNSRRGTVCKGDGETRFASTLFHGSPGEHLQAAHQPEPRDPLARPVSASGNGPKGVSGQASL